MIEYNTQFPEDFPQITDEYCEAFEE